MRVTLSPPNWLPALLLLPWISGGCKSEEDLRREEPRKYWEKVLRREYPGTGGQVTEWGLEQRDVSALIGLLRGDDAFYQAAAASVLAGEPALAEPGLPALTELLRSEDASVRGAAIYGIGRIGEVSAAPLSILMKALKNPDPGVRWQAAGWLAGMKPGAEAQAAVADLTGLFGDDSEPMRCIFAEALAAIETSSAAAVTALKAGLRDRDNLVRLCAAKALLRLRESEEAMMAIDEVLKSKEVNDRQIAAGLLGNLARELPELLPLFIEALADRDSAVRRDAVLSLRWPDPAPPELVTAVGERVRDESATVRVAALWTLQDLGPGASEALATITAALDDSVADVRWGAATVLVKMGAQAAPAEVSLEEALNDPDVGVRAAARNALKQIRE